MKLSGYEYAEPDSVDEAVAILAERGEDAAVMSGGTALMLLLAQGLIEPAVVVGLRPRGELGSLATIERTNLGLVIGALTTLRAIERSTAVRDSTPGLAQAAHRVASVRVRNQATLGGHVAHADPAQDLPPVLLALDATVDVVGAGGGRSVPIGELAVDVFETSLAPDEIITHVRVPAQPPGSRFASVAFRWRSVEDYPTVAVAVRIRVDQSGTVADARIALGAVAATAIRARASEAILTGRVPDDAAIADAVERLDEVLDPVEDARTSASYRSAMARVWTRRMLLEATSTGDRHGAAA